MARRAPAILSIVSLAAAVLITHPALAASFVERNSNVVGQTPPGYYRGIPAMQDNEVSCAFNPLLVRNIVCAWNASGGSDDPAGPGDTAIRMSESFDGGVTFINRYINGTRLNPATSIGVQFTADPITLCWPGGCGILHIGADRGEAGGTGGGIYMQRSIDSNTETGFRKLLEPSPVQVYRTTGSKFADKVNGTYALDVDNPGTIDVTLDIEKPDGTVETVVRQWPKARIIVTFALFNPSKNDIEILSTYSDCYGCSWSSPKQVAVTSGRDQGVSVTAMGNTLLYAFRVFESDQDPNAFRGVISPDRGKSMGKPFDIVSPVCAYDTPTLPNATQTAIAASRNNAFPSVANNGQYFIMVYSERKLNSDGSCFTDLGEPTDSRVKMIAGSADGLEWSDPVEIAPNPGHGFQFKPVVECALGDCQVGWWDSRFDTQRVTHYLQNISTNPKRGQALEAFLNLPVLGDFNYVTKKIGETITQVIQFRRTARVLTSRIEFVEPDQVAAPAAISVADPVAVDDPPAVVSKYQRALVGGSVRELRADFWNIKGYRDSFSPFMGDYSGMAAVRQRLVFDPDDPAMTPYWEDNASVDVNNPDKEPFFWMSFVSSRNVRGDIFTATVPDKMPYARTPFATTGAMVAPDGADADNPDTGDEEPLVALSVEDFNIGANTCAPVTNPGPGVVFDALNNRTKDFDIYGALIENKTTAFSLNPTKTLNVQRSYVFVAENAGLEPATFRFFIANQPAGAPDTARASWDQLPISPADPGFGTSPNPNELIEVDPQSSESLPLFVYAETDPNPVAIEIYESIAGGPETLINTITVNGAVESGNFLNLDGTVNTAEFHNPKVYTPDEFNPDEFNPDEYNPDEFNPGLYTPDEFNPDEFNPDEFNPDEFNPDEFNPDEFNPDEFNPDEFNPDEFNPDEFNSPLTDPATIDNPEIPKPILGDNIGDLVVKKDINFGVQNVGNTITPYTVDFAINDPEILALIEAGSLATQLIAWQDKKINDAQFCAPRIISENRVLSAVNNPDLTELLIPDIIDNRLGILTYTIAPNDVVQNTLRFIAPLSLMQQISPQLTADNISYMFASQIANTGSTSLFVNEELIVSPQFNFLTGETTTFEATGPDGAIIPTDLVRAFIGPQELNISCTPALGSTVGLDIENDPMGPTPLVCDALQGTDVVRTLNMFVSVLDNTDPIIDESTIPDDDPTTDGFEIVRDATSPSGAEVIFTKPTANDPFGVDPDVDVSCLPASGSLFPFDSPGPTRTSVTCTATDDSGNEAEAIFDVVLQDVSAPVFEDFDPPDLAPPLPQFELDPDDSTFTIFWGPFTVADADAMPVVECNVGELFSFDPLTSQYTFVHDFEAGTTNVSCTATDANGFVATGEFSVTVFDVAGPVVTLLGDPEITVLQGSGPYVDPGATANDVVDGDVSDSIVIDASAVNTDVAGTYEVLITASDNWEPVPNTTTVTRTVIVEFQYAGASGVIPQKLSIQRGSSNPMFWAWLDEFDNPVDSSGDMQRLRISNCRNGETVVDIVADDSGSSDFRFKVDNYWQFNWDADVKRGEYCAVAESSLTGQQQFSPPIEVR